MIYTQLSPSALPGRTYSFSPKEEETHGLKPSDKVTALSVMALPGPLHAFVAKSQCGVSPKPSTRITELSVMALPGMIHHFTAKEAAIVEAIKQGGGGKKWIQRQDRLRARILREDKELMEFISILVETEMLN